MTYRVIHCNDQMYGVYRVFGCYETLQEAREARKVSGDVVVNEEGAVITDRSWLFPWEMELCGLVNEKRTNKHSYALRLIEWQERCPEPYLQFMNCREVK